MNFYWFDLVQFGIAVISVYFLIKVKNDKIRFIPLGLLLLSFFFTPVNFTEKNATSKFTTNREVPEKVVVVEKETFEERHKKELEELKKQSKEKRNETIE